jgi:small subunit ribosomal protein S2
LATAHQEAKVTIKDLVESGAHFGHQTRRWNPKMKRFIFEERNGIYIIDLSKTLTMIRSAVQVVRDIVGKRKRILFVGTKKQAQDVVEKCAKECDEFFICERWLGGSLTNLTTIRNSVNKLDQIDSQLESSQVSGLLKKEVVKLEKSRVKLDRNLCGVRKMKKLPGMIVVVDPSREHIAVAEANKLGIPVMALVDTNCNPDNIDHIIPCNDDAHKSIKLVLTAIMQAVIDKKNEMHVAIAKGDDVEGSDEEISDEEASEE